MLYSVHILHGYLRTGVGKYGVEHFCTLSKTLCNKLLVLSVTSSMQSVSTVYRALLK